MSKSERERDEQAGYVMATIVGGAAVGAAFISYVWAFAGLLVGALGAVALVLSRRPPPAWLAPALLAGALAIAAATWLFGSPSLGSERHEQLQDDLRAKPAAVLDQERAEERREAQRFDERPDPVEPRYGLLEIGEFDWSALGRGVGTLLLLGLPFALVVVAVGTLLARRRSQPHGDAEPPRRGLEDATARSGPPPGPSRPLGRGE